MTRKPRTASQQIKLALAALRACRTRLYSAIGNKTLSDCGDDVQASVTTLWNAIDLHCAELAQARYRAECRETSRAEERAKARRSA